MIHNLIRDESGKSNSTKENRDPTVNGNQSIVIDSIEVLHYHKSRIESEVSATPFRDIEPLKDVLLKSEKETLDGKVTVILSDDSECIDALHIILALFTPINTKSDGYQFLMEKSSEWLPLQDIRREFLNFIKLLYDACFKPKQKHILPILDITHADTVSDFDRMRLEDECYMILGQSICKVLFSGVEQVITSSGSIYHVMTPNVVVKNIMGVYSDRKRYRKKKAKFEALSPEEQIAYKKSKADKCSESPIESVYNKSSTVLQLRNELRTKVSNKETLAKIQALQSAPAANNNKRNNIHLQP